MAENRQRIFGFSASGILGTKNYSLSLEHPASIIVGPNGTGKSTFLSLFYLFISRQWLRLGDYDFKSLTVTHSIGETTLTRDDLIAFDADQNKRRMGDRYLLRARELGAVDLLYKGSLSREEREKLSRTIGIPTSELTNFRRYVQTEFGFSRRGYEIDEEISSLNLGEILFLPTYRRIEKDIKSIFPDIESRIRSRFEEGYVAPRAGAGFK